jgi:hypothetical protein
VRPGCVDPILNHSEQSGRHVEDRQPRCQPRFGPGQFPGADSPTTEAFGFLVNEAHRVASTVILFRTSAEAIEVAAPVRVDREDACVGNLRLTRQRPGECLDELEHVGLAGPFEVEVPVNPAIAAMRAERALLLAAPFAGCPALDARELMTNPVEVAVPVVGVIEAV